MTFSNIGCIVADKAAKVQCVAGELNPLQDESSEGDPIGQAVVGFAATFDPANSQGGDVSTELSLFTMQVALERSQCFGILLDSGRGNKFPVARIHGTPGEAQLLENRGRSVGPTLRPQGICDIPNCQSGELLPQACVTCEPATFDQRSPRDGPSRWIQITVRAWLRAF